MEQQGLAKGTVIGERFEVDSLAGVGDMGFVYKARDTSNSKLIALRVIPRTCIPNEADVDRMRMRVKEAASLTHRNVRSTFGMGVEPDGTIFISTEWVEGQNLRTLLQKRFEAGKRFSFKGAYNILGHVCNALTYAHSKTHHGGLSPRAIMVNNAGRVKVSDWGLSIIRTRMEDYPGRKKVESVFWAPEVMKSAASVSPRSDIYALGAIFYELICGVPPQRPLKAPSLLGFSKDVDTVIARCMAADPLQRFDNAAAVKNAISTLVRQEADQASVRAAGAVDDDLGIDVEIDLADMGVAEPGAKFKQPVPTFSAAKGAGLATAPAAGMLKAAGLPAPPSRALGTDGAEGEGRASTIDMGAVISSLGKTEAAKWMVQKDKFDHGPFTDRELIQMIMLGEVAPKHILSNMDTGVRKKVKAWGEFDEYLERYRLKKKEAEEQAALVRTEKAEKRGTAFKVVIAAAIIGGIGLILASYLLFLKPKQDGADFDRDNLVAALDSGEIKLKGASGDLIGGKKGGGKRRKGGKGSDGEFLPGMSYEDAMNQGVDLGSLASNSGQKQLTAADIQNVMDRHVRQFLPCMDGSTKKVTMDIAVGGDGRVIGVSVKEGSSKLKGCVSSKVRGVRFPASGAPRTATSWWFEIY